ncbi:ABC transporter substrate-binding protein [Chloroflexota bacterium]
MIRKQKTGIKIIMVVLGALLLLAPFTGCAVEKAKEPVVFGYGGWDTVQFMSNIAGFIVEHGYGHPVEYMPATNVAIIAAVQRGDIDIHMEIAERSLQEPMRKLMESGQGEKVGISFPGTWQGWLVPTYMIENGDLPEGVSVEDMPKYWELFKDPEEPTKGRFYSCIPGWQCEKTNNLKIEAYGLDKYYNVFTPGSDAALSASLVGAYEKGEPWFGYYWSPTWVLAKVDMTPLEEPTFDDKLWTEKAKYASEYPLDENLIVVNVNLRGRAPEVVEFLGNYQNTYEQINDALLYMKDNEAEPPETAVWFLKNYESVWTQWVPSDVASKVKAALP